MNRASITMFAFGIYMAIMGTILLIAPEIVLRLGGITTPANLGWRMFGMILLYLAYYYFRSGLQEKEMKQFFLWTVQARSTVIIFFLIFVLLGLTHWIIIIFGLIDLAGALLTLWALRTDND